METRFYEGRKLMDAAFEENDLHAAKILAKEYLTLANDHSKDWNYGNAIHHANLMLGSIALKKGNLEEAKAFLLKAGQTPGSPQLNSFGPNMRLAKALLELGETAVVLEYLDLCASFWQPQEGSSPFGNIAQWKMQIQNKEIPHFGGHLAY